MYQSLIEFFEEIINGQVPVALPPEMKRIGSDFCFTLPSLYRYLNDDEHCSYLQFRSQIYQSTLNTDLAQLGWAVDIVTAADHVDQTVYGLLPLARINLNCRL
ncbi:hypothetical protein SIN8267_03519 [Sinobacterium norvegicum]|uniref:Uncharacterized protein n=2 Tax=Sinobacterium norvegicum TaxID=1641715 RepID=A0ABM9AJF4_9GAMM|nr:hypothetical protein SIN8267_03519 [Sinobacterium norvegicum]